MSRVIVGLLEKAALTAVTLAVCFMALEFVVFRYILVPDDVLPNVSINGVVRYQPNTRAIFRHPDGTSTRVTINAEGWNSTRAVYRVAKRPGRSRIAVIGDSYVHAKFVNPEDGFPHLVERALRARGQNVEVYRFGMDGAPLSQHLHVLRREVLKYKPDVVVIPLIHNDFDESYRNLSTRYASSFMKLREQNGRIVDVPPAPFQPGLADKLRSFATFRYLYYETNLYLHLKQWISRFYWGGNEDWDPAFVSSAVDIRKIADHQSNRKFARHVLSEIKALSQQHGFKLLLLMDGVREAIYERRPITDFEVGRLNLIARSLADELDLNFVDLHEAFQMDFAVAGQRFEFPYDWHWNAHGNRVVADKIVAALTGEAKPCTRATSSETARLGPEPGARTGTAGLSTGAEATGTRARDAIDDADASDGVTPPVPSRRVRDAQTRITLRSAVR